jgi:hypothetical protein
MNVLILGDSFTYGHGCSDRTFYFDFEKQVLVGERMDEKPPSEFCWASLLQKDHPNLEVFNLSVPGRSMQGMFYDFITFLKDKTDKKMDILFFNCTAPDRVEMPMAHDHDQTATWGLTWDNALPDPLFKSGPEEFLKAREKYRKYLWNYTIGDQLSLSGLYAAYGLAKSLNIKFMHTIPPHMFWNLSFIDFVEECMSDNELPSIWGYDFSTSSDKDFNKQFESICGHANDLGHQVLKPAMTRILGA